MGSGKKFETRILKTSLRCLPQIFLSSSLYIDLLPWEGTFWNLTLHPKLFCTSVPPEIYLCTVDSKVLHNTLTLGFQHTIIATFLCLATKHLYAIMFLEIISPNQELKINLMTAMTKQEEKQQFAILSILAHGWALNRSNWTNLRLAGWHPIRFIVPTCHYSCRSKSSSKTCHQCDIQSVTTWPQYTNQVWGGGTSQGESDQ